MALDRPVHAPEAEDGTTALPSLRTVAPGSAAHGGLTQTPPIFGPRLAGGKS